MTQPRERWQVYDSGSTGLGTDNSLEGLFGSVSSLSSLNDDTRVRIYLESKSGNSFRVGESGNVSNDIGITIDPGASGGIFWPDARAGTASQLQAVNTNSGQNASIIWTVFQVELD